MKRTAIFIISALIIFSPVLGYSENIQKVSDNFYSGIAKIIENHMDSPDACVSAVQEYWTANQSTVQMLREETQKHMATATQMMDDMMKKYESMSEEELQAMEEKMQKHAQQMSPGISRYNHALQAFTTKYPIQGSKIASLAMQMMPQS